MSRNLGLVFFLAVFVAVFLSRNAFASPFIVIPPYAGISGVPSLLESARNHQQPKGWHPNTNTITVLKGNLIHLDR